MAFFNKSSNDLHSSICFFLVITLILNLSTTTDSISFNIPHFQQNDLQIKFEGDSFLSDNIIELTKNSADDTLKNSVGRITYSEPIQLWDATTGRITDFDTHFSFIIKGLNDSSYGDGLTFFLAPLGSKLPPNSHGGSLGLLSANVSQKNLTSNQIVAVEFDSYKDPWDLCADHVGVNINSVVSVATAPWAGSIKDGSKANAWVRYNATTKNLTVFLTYAKNPRFSEKSTLYHIFDLSKVLPEQITVGFSASTGLGVEIHKILSWQFNSSLKTARRVETESNSVALLTGLVVGICGACGLGVCLLICLKKRRENTRINDEEMENSDMSMDDEFESGTGAKRFSYNELVHATNNFDEGGKLGEGGFGGVYKGFLSDLSLSVAVKRISRGSKQGKKEYKSEVRIISQLRHRNLVQLVGWCHERNEMLLVYEFMPNRSLDNHLFKGETVLTWEVRYKIALGLASALLYLHEECEQCVVHRDIKSSNVMLDSNFNAKLGDFGLARLVDHELGSQTTVLAGTMGYLAPECIFRGKSSKESDVYSFGIVALEIACGRKPEEVAVGISLVEWVWGLYGSGKLIEAADERLKMEFNELEMEQLMVVGLWCAHPDSKSRPSAAQVLNALKFESPLPKLPFQLPIPVYLPTSPLVPDLSSFAGLTDTLTGR